MTTTLMLVLSLAGWNAASGAPWWEWSWSVAFAATVPPVGAIVYARWQPRRLRMAAQTYLWLAMRAEENWARLFGPEPVPRDERSIRAALASMPQTQATSIERFGLWMALLDLDRARASIGEMANETPQDRFFRASSSWLVDFVDGTTHPLEPLQPLVEALDDPGARMEAAATLAVSQARVALSEGQDWQAPLAAIRDRLGTAPEIIYARYLQRPTFRALLVCSVVGIAVFWLAVRRLAPYFSFTSP